jgi:hypothetical protein
VALLAQYEVNRGSRPPRVNRATALPEARCPACPEARPPCLAAQGVAAAALCGMLEAAATAAPAHGPRRLPSCRRCTTGRMGRSTSATFSRRTTALQRPALGRSRPQGRASRPPGPAATRASRALQRSARRSAWRVRPRAGPAAHWMHPPPPAAPATTCCAQLASSLLAVPGHLAPGQLVLHPPWDRPHHHHPLPSQQRPQPCGHPCHGADQPPPPSPLAQAASCPHWACTRPCRSCTWAGPLASSPPSRRPCLPSCGSSRSPLACCASPARRCSSTLPPARATWGRPSCAG